MVSEHAPSLGRTPMRCMLAVIILLTPFQPTNLTDIVLYCKETCSIVQKVRCSVCTRRKRMLHMRMFCDHRKCVWPFNQR